MCICVCISATALCAFGLTGFQTPLSKCCFPTFCFLLILGPSHDPDGQPDLKSRPPMSCLRKPLFLLQVLVNTHYSALWIHHIIHNNLNCCYTPNVLFTFSLSCKIIIFSCSFENLTTCKSKIVQTRQGLSLNTVRPGPQSSLPEITLSASLFH